MADIKLKQLEEQLKRIGCNFRFWGRPELRELAHVLFPGEIVEHCVNGSYEGGFAMLVATDQRVLLVDKKPFYLTLEDIRYDMISEIDYNHRLINSTVFICTPNKSMRFLGYNHDRLRKLFHFAQTKVMEIRQHYQHQGQMWKDYAQSLQGGPVDQPAIPAEAFSATPLQGMDQPPAMPAPSTTGTLPANDMTQSPPLPPPPLPFRTVAPVISAYTRLPMMSRQRRFLGSRAIRPISSSMQPGQQS